MAELMDYVGVMADQIGPRPVSTEEEHQASLYLAQELSDDGLDVDVDEFATPTGVRWPFAIAFLLAILGTVVSGVGIFVRGTSLTMFVLGIILIAVGFFVYYSELNNKPVLSKMRTGGVSQNVVARYIPESARREQRRRKVIVVAHVDTVKAELEAMPALIRHAPLLRRIVYYVMIGVAVLTIVRLLPLPWPRIVDTALWVVSLVGCVYLLLAVVCIVARRFTPYVSGGNDNASAGAVLLGVAKRISDPAERARRSQQRRSEEAQAGGAGPRGSGYESLGAQEDAGMPPAPAADDATQILEPVAGAAPTVHDAQTAQAAGVVPDGAELTYDVPQAQGASAATDAAVTTVIPAVGGQGAATGAQVAPGTSGASAQVAVPGQAGASPVQEEVLGQDPNFPQPDYPEIVEDPAAQAAQQPAAQPAQDDGRPKPSYQPLPDGLFAQNPAESVEGEARSRIVAPEEPAAADSRPEPLPEMQEPAGKQAESAAPTTEPAVERRPRAESARRPEKNVPSWYAAAKKKAAQDMEARGKEPDDEKGEPQKFRSRYAQIPVNGSMENVRRAMESEAEAEPLAAVPEGAPLADATRQGTQQDAAQAADGPAPAASATAEGAGEQAATDSPAVPDADGGSQAAPSAETEQETSADEAPGGESLDFGLLDDEIDDVISPEMSGMFAAVGTRFEASAVTAEKQPADSDANEEAQAGTEKNEAEAGPSPDEAPREKNGILKGLTSRIPIIGSSDDSADAVSARRAREGAATAGSDSGSERGQSSKPRPERRKPTARHITQEFEPTKPVSARENENESLSSLRQEAAVSSTYEGTPQAGPEYDPFVPNDEQPYDAYGNPTDAFPTLSGQGTGSAASGAGDFGGSPGNSASFPSLSGSFPSLSGQIPRVSAGDFGSVDEADFGYEPTSDDVAESYGNPNLTGEINIPESRFHSAVDKVSGLFGHKDKKDDERRTRGHRGRRDKAEDESYDGFDDGNVDNWDEDDDFGWKGGAYVPEEYGYAPEESPRSAVGSAFEAAKARAAEIKDSVIEMSEDDLLDKEVWFVALGASGGGNQGMKNFIELHGPELRGALIINLEAVGAGTLHYVDFEGTGKSRRSDRRLQSLVRKASRDIDGKEMRPQKLEWRNTDATPAMAAGLRAMTIMGFDGPAPVAWHWSDDTSDIVDPDHLEYATELVLGMIENS